MTVRTAELLMAILMALFSVYLMAKSAELPIGWEPGVGPGGGAWPFWLAVVMLLCCGITIVRWFMRITPESRATEQFMDATTRSINFTTIGSLFTFLLLTGFIGIYFSMLLFLIFYLRFVGGHGWLLTLGIAIGLPVFMFFFFEGLLKIILPKGLSEPLFYPLYRFIY